VHPGQAYPRKVKKSGPNPGILENAAQAPEPDAFRWAGTQHYAIIPPVTSPETIDEHNA
jgi:hypothetical protein